MRTYLKVLRTSNCLSQFEVANRLGISQPYYCDIENGKRQLDLSFSYLNDMSKVFNIPVEEVIALENSYRLDANKNDIQK